MVTEATTMKLWAEANPQLDPHEWTFNGAPTRELTHCYHDYPARMIPQVAGKLLDSFGQEAQSLFDPYCGSGTSLVEGVIRGINVKGTDLNPLARLMGKAKTSFLSLELVDKTITELHSAIRQDEAPIIEYVEGVSRLLFWFKESVVSKLSLLKTFIEKIEDQKLQWFFQVAFSETVRESSNTRNEEFKLYRYEDARLDKFNPDVYGIMMAKLARNRDGLKSFLSAVDKLDYKPTAHIYDFNTVEGVPTEKVASESIDIVITSPPYGDSGTTVAYGQYSRLSAAWLGLPEADKIDQKLMGSKKQKELPDLPSEELSRAIKAIAENHQKRALEVGAFYNDLYKSIGNVAKLVRLGGHACYVVGNRKVKEVVLPTDIAVKDFFIEAGFDYVDTFHRSIPNKRMPSRNSPSNAPGKVDSTMTREYIVVMKRRVA
jgi:tRNA G10  N-methylase Trm11